MLRSVVPNMMRLDVRSIAAETSARIGEEIDYRIEARHQADFADAFRGHPFIRIPEIVPELSSQQGDFPNEQAALKCVYLANMSLDSTGKGRQRWMNRWKAPLSAFEIAFEGCLTAGRK